MPNDNAYRQLARRAGREAYAAGRPISTNPHIGVQAEHWRIGWRQAAHAAHQPPPTAPARCLVCGSSLAGLPAPRGGRPRKFCSPTHSSQWHAGLKHLRRRAVSQGVRGSTEVPA